MQSVQSLCHDRVLLFSVFSYFLRHSETFYFIIRGCLLSVPYRKALPKMGRAFQFVEHRDGVILN